MQRKSTAALCLLAVAILLACSRNGPPDSLFESAGYHVRDGKVYYLNAFPGKAFEISDADAASFEALDSTYGRDKAKVFVNGHQLADADAASFELLDRPNVAKDVHHVYQLDRVISADPGRTSNFSTAAWQRTVTSSTGVTVGAVRGPVAFRRSSPTPTTICSPKTARPYTSTATRSRCRPRDICSPARRLRPRRPTRLLFRPDGSPMRICRPSVRSTVPTRATPRASTGSERPSTARTRRRFAY